MVVNQPTVRDRSAPARRAPPGRVPPAGSAARSRTLPAAPRHRAIAITNAGQQAVVDSAVERCRQRGQQRRGHRRRDAAPRPGRRWPSHRSPDRPRRDPQQRVRARAASLATAATPPPAPAARLLHQRVRPPPHRRPHRSQRRSVPGTHLGPRGRPGPGSESATTPRRPQGGAPPPSTGPRRRPTPPPRVTGSSQTNCTITPAAGSSRSSAASSSADASRSSPDPRLTPVLDPGDQPVRVDRARRDRLAAATAARPRAPARPQHVVAVQHRRDRRRPARPGRSRRAAPAPSSARTGRSRRRVPTSHRSDRCQRHLPDAAPGQLGQHRHPIQPRRPRPRPRPARPRSCARTRPAARTPRPPLAPARPAESTRCCRRPGRRIVVDPDPVQPEHLGEHPGQDLLHRPCRGARNAAALATKSGAGNARRSSLPFAVNGNSSSTTTAAGTMYSGSRPATNSRTRAGSSPAPAAAVT